MEKIKITCPNCRSLLSIEQTPGIGDKMLSCPICRFRAKVSVFQQQSLGNIRQSADDDEPTQVNFAAMDRTIGSLFLGDKEFSLHKGPNTIGRKAQTGHAEVQLCDSNGEIDRYMSRNHAVITIKEGGSGLEHHLQPSNPKNPIKINGQQLQNADVVVLQWGDRLTFGHTELIFERPHYNEDQTMIEG